jgi:hypothetical protein
LQSTTAASAVVVSGVDGGFVLTAVSLTNGPLELTFPAWPDRTVTALLYDSTLEELNIAPGDLAIVPDGFPLPKPDQTFTLEIKNGVGGGWTPSAAPSMEIASLSVARVGLCAQFRRQTFVVSSSVGEPATLAIAEDASRVLLGVGRKTRFYEATMTGTIAPIGSPAPIQLESGFRDGTGDLWYAGESGYVAHGLPGNGLTRVASMPNSSGPVWIDGSRDPAVQELFALTGSLAIEWYRNGAWTTVRPRIGPVPDQASADVAWVAPGFAVAIGKDLDVVTEIQDGVAKDVRLAIPTPPTDAFYRIAWVDGFGPVAGTRYNRLFVRSSSGAWSLLAVPPSNSHAYVLLPLGKGGILFGGQRGILTEYFRGAGYCTPTSYSSTDIDRIAPLGTGFVFLELTSEGVNATRLE